MSNTVELVLQKMRLGGAHPVELAAMRRRMEQLSHPDAGQLPGETLQPLDDLPRLRDLPLPGAKAARAAVDRFAVVKLNGGLGTGMGLSGPKSLLEVKPGHSFLDLVAMQVLAIREQYGVKLPLLLMNSASTRDASLAALAMHPAIHDQAVPIDFMQGREPKLRSDNLEPVEWPANRDLEWCPPGHGDLYTALTASGVIDQLLDAGVRWCFVSNADNLGALFDVGLATWIATNEVPFTMEAVRGTPADRKGGHLARLDGRVIVRETAQVPDDDKSFTDINRWRYYNTNNLWVDLEVLKQMQAADPASPTLPLIINRKTVDPRDPHSTAVIQLETAMGAAVGSIPGARAIHVPRTRFSPVKTTNDLLVVRSDAYELTSDARMKPTFAGAGPIVTLDGSYYKFVADFEQRLPVGAPSLQYCTRLDIEGDVTFGADIHIEGDMRLVGPQVIPDGQTLHGPAKR